MPHNKNRAADTLKQGVYLAKRRNAKIALLLALNIAVCTAVVVFVYLLKMSVFIHYEAGGPWLEYYILWLILFLLGFPLLRLYEKLQEIQSAEKDKLLGRSLEMVSVLNELLIEKDPAIEYHCKRVANLTRTFCDFLGIDMEQSRTIVFAAMFHDIGKLFLDKKLLNPHETLSDHERKQYNSHPVIGEKFLSKIDSYPGAAKIVRHHHEQWDGKGFPENLSGHLIPYGSRIISLAEVFDALENGMDTEPPLSKPDVLLRIESLRNKRFDPELTDEFLRMMRMHPNS